MVIISNNRPVCSNPQIRVFLMSILGNSMHENPASLKRTVRDNVECELCIHFSYLLQNISFSCKTCFINGVNATATLDI